MSDISLNLLLCNLAKSGSESKIQEPLTFDYGVLIHFNQDDELVTTMTISNTLVELTIINAITVVRVNSYTYSLTIIGYK